MRVDIVDPPAFSPPYDHALATALSAAGAQVRLITSEFAHGPVPDALGYERELCFYRRARGAPGSRRRGFSKLASHSGDMRRYRKAAREADVVHFQWLTLPRSDLRHLPRRPVVLTIHDPLERGGLKPPLRPGAFNRVKAIIVHTEYASEQVRKIHRLPKSMVHVIPHGVLGPSRTGPAPLVSGLPPELPQSDRPVVLCFGLLRPYKGVEVLLDAWRGIEDADLWIVGRPMMAIDGLVRDAPANVHFVERFVTDAEEAALYRRADIAVLPYERSERFGFSGVLATAIGSGKAIVLSDVGGLAEVADHGAAKLVAPGDPEALRNALRELIASPAVREQLSAAALSAAAEVYSWEAAAQATLELYAKIGAK